MLTGAFHDRVTRQAALACEVMDDWLTWAVRTW
jgi:hypothetical protein